MGFIGFVWIYGLRQVCKSQPLLVAIFLQKSRKSEILSSKADPALQRAVTVRHWQHTIAAQRGASAREDALEEMLILFAADLLPLRPGRREPRVLKRRPKPYQYLTRPRHLMRVSPSRDNKGKPRKTNSISSLN